jgi:Ca2+-binding RTX toxin-like protein
MVDVAANATTTAVLEGFGADLGSYSGQLETAGDHDWIKVELVGGATYNFSLCFASLGLPFEQQVDLVIRDANGTAVPGGSDDGTNVFLTLVAPSTGTFYLDISAVFDDVGEYSLAVISGILTENSLTGGNDTYADQPADDLVLGGGGADYIALSNAIFAIGEQGNDIILGSFSAGEQIFGGIGHDTIDGAGGMDILFGDAGNDELNGNDGDDILFGGLGNDVLIGGIGDDEFHGGAGKDTMIGDEHNNTFVFTALSDSKKGALRDVITAFRTTDTIDLSAIDAKTGGVDNAFKFIGKQDFHDKKGELHYVVKNGVVVVEGDVNGNGKADFQIEVRPIGAPVLTAADFDL